MDDDKIIKESNPFFSIKCTFQNEHINIFFFIKYQLNFEVRHLFIIGFKKKIIVNLYGFVLYICLILLSKMVTWNTMTNKEKCIIFENGPLVLRSIVEEMIRWEVVFFVCFSRSRGFFKFVWFKVLHSLILYEYIHFGTKYIHIHCKQWV